jgi:hypothetical protein
MPSRKISLMSATALLAAIHLPGCMDNTVFGASASTDMATTDHGTVDATLFSLRQKFVSQIFPGSLVIDGHAWVLADQNDATCAWEAKNCNNGWMGLSLRLPFNQVGDPLRCRIWTLLDGFQTKNKATLSYESEVTAEGEAGSCLGNTVCATASVDVFSLTLFENGMPATGNLISTSLNIEATSGMPTAKPNTASSGGMPVSAPIILSLSLANSVLGTGTSSVCISKIEVAGR